MADLISVTRASDIPPGEARTFIIRKTEIAVFNIHGQFYAIDNLCPHEGGPLVTGQVKGLVITCPWHFWQFNLETGVSPANPSICVNSYPVMVEDGELKIEKSERKESYGP